MTFRNELTIDAPLQLTRLFGVEAAFSPHVMTVNRASLGPPGPPLTMPSVLYWGGEGRIIEPLCDEIDRSAGVSAREKLSLDRWNDLGSLIGEFRILFKGDQRFKIFCGHRELVSIIFERKGGGKRKKERKGRKKKEEG